MFLLRFVGEIQFSGRPMLLKFRMVFEQIPGLLEGLLKMLHLDLFGICCYIWQI